ncbi:MAG: hypothetical protein ACR2IQ_02860 [Minisyncoccia bacterium]
MSYKQVQQHIAIHTSGKQVYRVVGTLCLLMIGLYVYFISAITFNVVERRGLETALKANESHIGQMQLNYLSLTKQYDYSYATAHGFMPVGHVAYVDRTPLPVAFAGHAN